MAALDGEFMVKVVTPAGLLLLGLGHLLPHFELFLKVGALLRGEAQPRAGVVGQVLPAVGGAVQPVAPQVVAVLGQVGPVGGYPGPVAGADVLAELLAVIAEIAPVLPGILPVLPEIPAVLVNVLPVPPDAVAVLPLVTPILADVAGKGQGSKGKRGQGHQSCNDAFHNFLLRATIFMVLQFFGDEAPESIAAPGGKLGFGKPFPAAV